MSNSSRAFSYLVVVAATLVGAWLFLGRATQADAPAPVDPVVELVPQVFQAGDRTCVYIGGELECFCFCAAAEACASYGDIILPQPTVITVPQIVTVPLIITRTVEVPAVAAQGESESGSDAGSTADSAARSRSTSSSTSSTSSISITQWDEGQEASVKPQPKDKPENPNSDCNQGVGNGEEGCDPGNSNQGDPARSNDELRPKGDVDAESGQDVEYDPAGTPGNPGRKGGNKVGQGKPTKE
jgi:hypothetical protein